MNAIKMWAATYRNGKINTFTVSRLRQDAMQKATETMMGANEYHRLLNRSDRWSHCYRRGYRLVPVTVAARDTP